MGQFSVSAYTRVARYKQTMWVDLCTRAVFPTIGLLADGLREYRLIQTNTKGNVESKNVFKFDFVASERFARGGEIDIIPDALPGVAVTAAGKINFWVGWKYAPVAGSVEPWLEWCKLFFSKDPEFEVHFHRWVGWLIQNPEKRHTTSVVFASSDEGSGKSFTAETIAQMIGTSKHEHATITGSGAIFDKFNEELLGKVLVVANEPSSDKDDHSAKWKDARTAPVISIDVKFGAKYQITNRINFLATTNNTFVTKVSEQSRRELVYKPNGLDLRHVRQMVTLTYNWLENGGYSNLHYWYLHQVDVSDFSPYDPAPATAGLIEMATDSLNELEYDVRDFLEKARTYAREHAQETGLYLPLPATRLAFNNIYNCTYSQQRLRKALQKERINVIPQVRRTHAGKDKAEQCYDISAARVESTKAAAEAGDQCLAVLTIEGSKY